MKAKFFLLALMVLFVSAQSSAQLGALMNPVENGGTKNLTIGFSPYGYTQYKIGMGDEKYKYKPHPKFGVIALLQTRCQFMRQPLNTKNHLA